MAGHPTIGSTFALAAEGALEPGRPEFVFELGVGPTPVSLEWGDAGLSFAWMTQPPPAFGAIVADRAGFAAAVGLDESDLAAGLPVQSVSCGVPFLFAPIASRRAVDSVAIDRRGLAKSCGSAGLGELPVFFFTTEPGEPRRPALQDRQRPSTAGCWRPDTASPKIPRPAARAARSAVTWSSTSWSAPRPRDRCSACKAWRWDARAGFTFRSRAVRAPSRASESADGRCWSGAESCISESASQRRSLESIGDPEQQTDRRHYRRLRFNDLRRSVTP